LDHHAKNKKCFVCNEPTLGIFNYPKKLAAKLKEMKEKEQQQQPSEETTEGGDDN
jgi:RING finger protein 113A